MIEAFRNTPDVPIELSDYYYVAPEGADAKCNLGPRRSNLAEIEPPQPNLAALTEQLHKPEDKLFSFRNSIDEFNKLSKVLQAYLQETMPHSLAQKQQFTSLLCEGLQAINKAVFVNDGLVKLIGDAQRKLSPTEESYLQNFFDNLLDFAEKIVTTKFLDIIHNKELVESVSKKGKVVWKDPPLLDEENIMSGSIAQQQHDFLLPLKSFFLELIDRKHQLLLDEQMKRFANLLDSRANGEASSIHLSALAPKYYDTSNDWHSLFVESYKARMTTRLKWVLVKALEHYGVNLIDIGYRQKRITQDYSENKIDQIKEAQIFEHLAELKVLAEVQQADSGQVFVDLKEILEGIQSSQEIDDLGEWGFELKESLLDLIDQMGIRITEQIKKYLDFSLANFVEDTVSWGALKSDPGMKEYAFTAITGKASGQNLNSEPGYTKGAQNLSPGMSRLMQYRSS
jgi:hypothetical protein